MSNCPRVLRYFFITTTIFFCQIAQAVDYDFSGFVSAVAGKSFSGEKEDYLGFDCPCFIADWPTAGVYENEWSFNPDSTYGLQGIANFNEDIKLTTQLVGHGSLDYKPELNWLYASYRISENWSVDIGRKALPLFYYSDFAPISYAYNWIRVPGDVYGWPITNYNGVSAIYMSDMGQGSVNLQLWLGEGKSEDNPEYSKLYFGVDYDVEWTSMIGTAFEYIIDWYSVRLVYMANKDTQISHFSVNDVLDDSSICEAAVLDDTTVPITIDGKIAKNCVISDGLHQDFYGLSMNVDYEKLIIRSEYNELKVSARKFHSETSFVSLGYKINKFIPAFTWSRYNDSDPSAGGMERQITLSYSVRWDLYPSTALKMQLDTFEDNTNWDFIGDAKVFALGVDYVF